MNHLILAETQFFALINGKDNGSTETAYGGFVQEVINLCYGGNDAKHIIVALAFAEIELQHHPQNLSASEENVVTVYIRKALSFIRKMQKMVSASAITSVPPLTSTSETKATVPALQWTGNAVELVEQIYENIFYLFRNMRFTSFHSPSLGAGSMPSSLHRMRYMFWFWNEPCR